MQLSLTGDGYIKCVADSEADIIAEQVTAINASNLSLPCMIDRYEKNVLFYHVGANISVFDYIKSAIMDFGTVKELAVNLAKLFIELESEGLPNDKIIADIRYIYINPSTKQLRVMQCPIEDFLEENSYQVAMASICNNVKSKNAYIAIGYILEEVRQDGFELKNFVRRLEKLENLQKGKNEAVETKTVVETQIVEKTVLVNKTSYLLSGSLAVLLELIGLLFIPLIWKAMKHPITFGTNIVSCGIIVVLTIAVFAIMSVCTKNSKNQVVSVNGSQDNARIQTGEHSVGRELAEVEAERKAEIRESAKVIKASKPVDDGFDETGLLEEEVEINPLKRQEQYHKNAVPVVYLIDEETNKKHEIRKSVFVVGRSSECDLVVDSTIVSKKHAEIVFENGVYYVRDLKSSNYTYLNKATIEPMELYKIDDGSRIGFGNKWFIFKTSL